MHSFGLKHASAVPINTNINISNIIINNINTININCTLNPDVLASVVRGSHDVDSLASEKVNVGRF